MTMLTVQFWGDLICPICPVGHAMLNAGIAQFPLRDSVEIVYRSSRLRPGVPLHTVNSYLNKNMVHMPMPRRSLGRSSRWAPKRVLPTRWRIR
jgi:predicted DsbA family dithiol-disulfide isomerase